MRNPHRHGIDKAFTGSGQLTSYAFITPTYRPDLERCELLVRSLDRFAPQMKHYLIVDDHEHDAFAHLASERTILVSAREIIGIQQLRVKVRQSFWLHPRTLPMRGWIRQQLLKMAAAAALGPDVLICLDSDVAFVEPFHPRLVIEEGKLGLLDVDYSDDMVVQWTRVSCQLLGLEFRSDMVRGYVGHLITWSRDHMLSLFERLEKVSGRPWQITIGRQRTFSEYNLYGVYIRECLGYEKSLHRPSTKALVRQPWGEDLASDEGLAAFIEQRDADNVAVMVHSKFDIPVERIRTHFDRLLANPDGRPQSA